MLPRAPPFALSASKCLPTERAASLPKRCGRSIPPRALRAAVAKVALGERKLFIDAMQTLRGRLRDYASRRAGDFFQENFPRGRVFYQRTERAYEIIIPLALCALRGGAIFYRDVR